jgi:quercetin dioxygenase-like cupin family protein
MSLIHARQLGIDRLEGAPHHASISLILNTCEPGQGPRLHRHPYDETFVVEAGNLTFQLGDELHRAEPGDVVVVPARVPHKFTNDGPGESRLVCIHANPTIVGEWLE